MYQNPLTDTNRLKVADEFLATGQTVPTNTNVDGDEGSKELAGTLGGLEVIVSAKTTVTLANTTKLTCKLMDSADNSSFADIAGASVVKTSAGAAWAAGTILARIPIPSNARRYIKLNIATDDTTPPTGTVDAFVDYLAK